MRLQDRLVCAEAFVFDFYGTLAEPAYEPPQMWEILNDLGYDSHPELQGMCESDAYDGCPTPALGACPGYEDWRRDNVRLLLRLSGVPDRNMDELTCRLLEVERTATKKAVPQGPDILRLLRRRGRRVGLCSNWDDDIQPQLAQLDLTDFDAVTVSAELGFRKPHAAMFFDICKKLCIEPANAVFVGDTWSTDVVGSTRVGLTPVWIRHFRPTRSIEGRVIEFDTLAELGSWLSAVV